jgi:hypothetical protein
MTRHGSIAALALAMLLPLAAAAQEPSASPLPDAGTELEPGRYSASHAGPTFEFSVGEGWLAGPSGDGPIFTLEYAESPGTVVSFTRFDGEAFLDSCDPDSTITVEPTVGRLAEIIAGNPFLNASTTRETEVGGFSGLVLDVGVPAFTECSLPYLLLWALPIGEGGEFVQLADQQSRFIMLDVGGDVIVVAVEAFPGVPFGAVLDATTELLESVTIEPGEYVPPAPEPSAAASPSPEASQAPEETLEPEASPNLPSGPDTTA